MRRGRPSSATHPTVVIRNIDSGQVAAWSDGEFAGDETLVRDARAIADGAALVPLGAGVFTPGSDTPRHAIIALLAACRSRAVVVTPDPCPDIPEGRCLDVPQHH